MVTTLNLSVFLLEYVRNRIGDMDIGVEKLIVLCLRKRVIELCRTKYQFFRAPVEYQAAGGGYVKVKVDFSWDEYDSNLLCRFVRKVSVSFLAAMAVHDYLEEILKELNGESSLKNNSIEFRVFVEKLIFADSEIMSEIPEKYQVTLTPPR